MNRQSPVLPSASILIAAALWGSMWIPVHVVRDAGLPGTWIAALIYGVPAFLLAPWCLRAGPRRLLRHWRLLGAIGVFTGLCNVLYVVGVSYGDVIIVILLFYLNPVWSALFERVALKSPITRWRALAIFIGLSGMWVLVASGTQSLTMLGHAEMAGLIAGISWAAALVVMRIGGSLDHMDKAFSQYAFALVAGLAVIGSGLFPADINWVDLPISRLAFWLLAISCLWVLPALILSFWGAARISPTRASMLFMAEVVVGVGSAALLGEGEFTWRHALGGAMIITSGFLDGLGSSPKRMEAAS